MSSDIESVEQPLTNKRRYGERLLAKSELEPFNFLIVYLAIIQGTLVAGQWLSFGPSKYTRATRVRRADMTRFCSGVRGRKPYPIHAPPGAR